MRTPGLASPHRATTRAGSLVVMTTTAIITLGISASGAFGQRWQQPTTGPKNCLVFPRPARLLDSNYNVVSPAEAAAAAAYGLIVSAVRPEEMTGDATNTGVRELNPDIIALFPVSLWGVPAEDYDGGWDLVSMAGDGGWMIADMLWSPIRTLQYAYLQNRAEGVDWTLRDTSGDPIEIWNCVVCNWTDECAIGVWGPTAGKTFREYAQEVYLEHLQRPAFTDAWDGYHFDTLPPSCCWAPEFQDVDFDGDGVSDACSGSCAVARTEDPFNVQQVANTEAFLQYLVAGKNPSQIITVGQDHVTSDVRESINGWKLEGWMTQDGKESDWAAWWNGPDSGPGNGSDYYGYHESELELVDIGVDSWQGWDMTIVDVILPDSWTPAQKDQHCRFALGTALLGDGWFSASSEDLEERYTIPEQTAWDLQLPPLGDVIPPSTLGGTEWRREYLRSNGDRCVIVVDTQAKDAWLFGFGACLGADDECFLLYENDCAAIDGTYLGDNTSCTPIIVDANSPAGGYVYNQSLLRIAYPGVKPVVSKSATNNGSGWECRAFFRFDTDGVLTPGDSVVRAEFWADVSTTAGQPNSWVWRLYEGTFIGDAGHGTVISSDWSDVDAHFCVEHTWEVAPNDSYIDLGSAGVANINEDGYTDIRIEDASPASAPSSWSVVLEKKCKLRLYFASGGSMIIEPQHASLDRGVVPGGLSLTTWPQPIAGAATLQLSIPESGHVLLDIFDVEGRRVAVVADENMSSGVHEIRFRPEDIGLSSGVYFARASAGVASVRSKFVVIR